MEYNRISTAIINNCNSLQEKTAYKYEDEETTYAMMSEMSLHIASGLASKVGKDFICSAAPVRIGICLPRKCHYISCLVAIVRLGASYVPLDIMLPDERKAYIINDANAAYIITEDNIHELLSAPILDELPCWHKSCSELYLFYTSGSTGQPKGVSVPYAAVSNFLSLMSDSETFNISKDSVILHFTSYSFDLSISEIFSSLYYGATLIIPSERDRQDMQQILRLVNREHVTFMVMTPSVFINFPNFSMPSLNCVYVCGEPVPVALTQRVFKSTPSFRFVNTYGPTETTVFVTAHIITHAEDNVNIGKPLPGTKCIVIDSNGNKVAAGEEGELLIGGKQLSNGYWNRPELNKKAFVTIDGEPFYHSGDKVRLNADGSFDFIGRMDSQIKIDGFRIELSEISSRIEMHPRVSQCIINVELLGKERTLVAYLTTNDGSSEINDIREYASKHLTYYMMPTFWNHVKEFHLNANRKIDRTQLQNDAWLSLQYNDCQLTSEQGIIMKEVARILDMKETNIDLDLFDDIGISSIVAMMIPVFLSLQGLPVTVNDIYRHRTIRKIADNIQYRRSYWYNDPKGDATKPVLVVISGYSSFDFLFSPLAEHIKEHYSIYVIESYFTFLQFRIVSGEELIEMYRQELLPIMEQYTIAAYTGLCMAGEQAICLAHKLHGNDAVKPTIYMIDGEVHTDSSEEHFAQMYWKFYTKEQNETINKQMMHYMATLPQVHYEGPIVTFLSNEFATEEVFDAIEPINGPSVKEWMRYTFDHVEEWWREEYPHCDIIRTPCNHYEILNKAESVKVIADAIIRNRK